MNNIIEFNSMANKQINVSALLRSERRLSSGMITPVEAPEYEIADNHTSEPIKDMDTIEHISEYLISKKRFRDNMLFIVGINFGLRVSDLRLLRFSHLIDSNLYFKDTFPVLELKTKNTRKVKKNRYITINNAVIESVTLFLENTPDVKLDDYMFRSESNNGYLNNEPINRKSIDRILKNINDELDLGIHMSTHTLRKTFAYHQMLMSNNDPRKLMLLSKMLGHSSILITMDYIGITDDEIQDAYKNLNLGSKYNYLDSHIEEREMLVG